MCFNKVIVQVRTILKLKSSCGIVGSFVDVAKIFEMPSIVLSCISFHYNAEFVSCRAHL